MFQTWKNTFFFAVPLPQLTLRVWTLPCCFARLTTIVAGLTRASTTEFWELKSVGGSACLDRSIRGACTKKKREIRFSFFLKIICPFVQLRKAYSHIHKTKHTTVRILVVLLFCLGMQVVNITLEMNTQVCEVYSFTFADWQQVINNIRFIRLHAVPATQTVSCIEAENAIGCFKSAGLQATPALHEVEHT